MFPDTIEYDKDYSHLVHWGEEIASFKWNWVDFLTDKEKKEQKNIIHPPPKPPKIFDINKASPIQYTPDEIREIRKKTSASPSSEVYNELIKTLEEDDKAELKAQETKLKAQA